MRNMVMRPINTAADFKAELGRIKRIRHFYNAGEAHCLAEDVENLVYALDGLQEPPEVKLKLLADIYKADGNIIGKCDDSDGCMNELFSEVANAFARFAIQCPDKNKIRAMIIKIHSAESGFYMSDFLIDKTGQFFPPEQMRRLADEFWTAASKAEDEHKMRHHYHAVESLAEQLKDPELYERACQTSYPGSTGFISRIAQVYYKSGFPEKALERLNSISPGETFQKEERDALAFEIYKTLGMKTELEGKAWEIFRSKRGMDKFNNLVEVLGEERKLELLNAEASLILAADKLNYDDAVFLMDSRRTGDLEAYILKHADALDGDYYGPLLNFAGCMEDHKCWTAATALYRALLESILARAISKYYHYGVQYLLMLDSLASKVQNWKGIIPHRAYFKELQAAHGKKSSFWEKYSRRASRV